MPGPMGGNFNFGGGGTPVMEPHPTVSFGQEFDHLVNGGNGRMTGNIPAHMQPGYGQGGNGSGMNGGFSPNYAQGGNGGNQGGGNTNWMNAIDPRFFGNQGQGGGNQNFDPRLDPRNQMGWTGGATQGNGNAGWGGNRQVAQLSDSTIMDGPDVPPELRGRSFGEIKRLYSGLAQHYVRTSNRFGPEPGQPGNFQGQNNNGQNFRGAVQDQGDGGGRDSRSAVQFFSDPRGAIREAVHEVVQEAIQPIQARTLESSVKEALAEAQRSIPDFGAMEGYIAAELMNINPQALANVETWRNAARLVRGRLMETGQYQQLANTYQQRMHQQGNRNGGYMGGGNNYGGGMQHNYQPMQNGGGGYVPANGYMPFFSESPGVSNYGEFGSGMLTPAQRDAAKKFGMSEETYLAWLGGVQR